MISKFHIRTYSNAINLLTEHHTYSVNIFTDLVCRSLHPEIQKYKNKIDKATLANHARAVFFTHFRLFYKFFSNGVTFLRA